MLCKDDCIGFTLARDFDPRELGLLYYVMASWQTLGEALKRIARYSRITNEALVFGYREGNRLIISLSYSGVPRHSDRHQIEFCMFAAIRICRMLTGQNLVPQHFTIAHHGSGGTSEMARFVGTKVQFGADTDEFALNVDARELPPQGLESPLNAGRRRPSSEQGIVFYDDDFWPPLVVLNDNFWPLLNQLSGPTVLITRSLLHPRSFHALKKMPPGTVWVPPPHVFFA